MSRTRKAYEALNDRGLQAAVAVIVFLVLGVAGLWLLMLVLIPVLGGAQLMRERRTRQRYREQMAERACVSPAESTRSS